MTTTAIKLRKNRLKQIDPVTDPDRYSELEEIILSDDLDIKHKRIDGIINKSQFLSNLDVQEYSPRLNIWEYLQQIDDTIQSIDDELKDLWNCSDKLQRANTVKGIHSLYPTNKKTELVYIDPAIQTPLIKKCLETGEIIPFSDYKNKMIHLFEREIRDYENELDNLYAVTPWQHEFLNLYYQDENNIIDYKLHFLPEEKRRAFNFCFSPDRDTLVKLIKRNPGSTYTKLSDIATKENLTDLYATGKDSCGRDHMKTLLKRLEYSGCIDVRYGKGNRVYYTYNETEIMIHEWWTA